MVESVLRCTFFDMMMWLLIRFQLCRCTLYLCPPIYQNIFPLLWATCDLCHWLHFVSCAICPKCLEDIRSSLWPDINICSCAAQWIITMIAFYSADFWPVLFWKQRQRLPCCCTGSCCSGRTGPLGISSTTPVRASGNARKTWVVKSSTTSTRERQVNFDWLQTS